MNRYTFLDYDLKTNEEYLKSIIQNKYKDNEEQFYKELKTTSQTFWKNFREMKVQLQKIFKTKELLELNQTEMLSIFFGETEITQRVLHFYNVMLKYIEPLSDEEKKDFLTKFSRRLDSLKEEQWWKESRKTIFWNLLT